MEAGILSDVNPCSGLVDAGSQVSFSSDALRYGKTLLKGLAIGVTNVALC